MKNKVLITAYACSPYKGSEFAVGWGFVEELSRTYKLWVVVEEEKCREDISAYLRDHPDFVDNVQFFFVKKRRNRWLRKIWPPSYYWYLRRWQKDVLGLARKLHRDVNFDIAHQLNMVGFREPGFLWKLGIPFVWGPIGGMGRVPWNFLPYLGFYGAFYYAGYNVMNALHERFLPRPKAAARAAGGGLLVATTTDEVGAEKFWGCRGTLLAEVGLPHQAVSGPTQRLPGEPLRLVWSGLHIPRKALNLGLRGLASMAPGVSWELHVLGKGDRTKSWMRLAKNLGISSQCYFHGWLPRAEALQVLGGAHAMLITSLRDLTSTVTVEALACGLPVVCLDHCGFSAAIDESCGIKVAVRSPAEAIQGIGVAVARLHDESFRFRLAQGALRRSERFSWPVKAAVVEGIYRCKVGGVPAV